MSYFDAAFTLVVGIEGGYVNDPRDPGGETKFGISKRRYPDEDIPNLTLARASELYRRDYWDLYRCDAMPWSEALLVFDTAVNGGHAISWRAMYAGSADFIVNYQAEHALYLASLAGWGHEGRGWMRRAFKIAAAAAKAP